MKLYRTTDGIFVEQQDRFERVPVTDWDELIRSASSRLAICVLFVKYRQPRTTVALFAALLAAAAQTNS
jgi:hypothetical protein